MNFTKPELQSIRAMITKELNSLEIDINYFNHYRSECFDKSDRNQAEETKYYYSSAKIFSNAMSLAKKQRDAKIILLRKVKDMIQVVDGKIPKSKMHPKKKMFRMPGVDTND